MLTEEHVCDSIELSRKYMENIPCHALEGFDRSLQLFCFIKKKEASTNELLSQSAECFYH